MLYLYTLLKLTFILYKYANAELELNPITENVSFKAIFRTKITVGDKIDSISEIQEQYQHTLKSAKVSLIKHTLDGRSEYRIFHYDGIKRIEIEPRLQKCAYIPNIHLHENGGSSSYEFDSSDEENSKVRYIHSLSQHASLSSLLFDRPDPRAPILELNRFLTEECLAKVDTYLDYIRGVSQIFHLLECLKDKFRLLEFSDKQSPDSVVAYVSDNLEVAAPIDEFVNRVDNIKLSVSFIKERNFKYNEYSLPSRAVPKVIQIQYDPDTLINIELFQFEINDVMEHLSESASSSSTFLMPQGKGVIDIIGPDKEKTGIYHRGDLQYSFKAFLTWTDYNLEDPIELRIVYDRPNRIFIRQTIMIDRSVLVGNSYAKRVDQLVSDGNSRVNFHLMDENYNYVYDLEDHSDDEKYWRSCSSSSMSYPDLELFENENVFSLSGAVFIGMAIVRGIDCYVYEKRLYNLPKWMDIGHSVHNHLLLSSKGDIYVTLYEVANSISSDSFKDEQEIKIKDDSIRKFARLIVHIADVTDEFNINVNKQFRYELYSFEWSATNIYDVSEILDIKSGCLMEPENSRSVDMSFILEPVASKSSENGLLYSKVGRDENRRNHLVSAAVTNLFGISPVQQLDLVTTIDRHDNIQVQLTAYELAGETFSKGFIGVAKDLSMGSAIGWTVGTTSKSTDECFWRTAHTIRSNKHKSDYYKKENENLRLFMYCPETLHCIIGDSKWNPILKGQKLRLRSILEYPSDEKGAKSCLIFSLSLSKQHSNSVIDTGNQPLLDWLVSKKELLIDKETNFELDDHRFSMKLSHLRIFKTEDTGTSSGRAFKGLSYDPTNSNWKVSSLKHSDQCIHACLIHHDCRSFSICLKPSGRIDCTLSRLHWTDPIKLSALQNFIDHKSNESFIEVIHENEPVKVQMKRSNLCTLHTQSFLDVFQLQEGGLSVITDSKYLISTESIDECAKFCINRAQIYKLVSGIDSKEELVNVALQTKDDSICKSFRYNGVMKICELLPLKDANLYKLARINEETKFNKNLIEGWKNVRAKLQSIERNLTRFIESDHYKFNYEHLYTVHTNRRLKLKAGKSNENLQVSFSDIGTNECAFRCLVLSGCRSFSLSPLNSETNETFCFLMTESWQSSSENFEMLNSIGWNFYEPSDLVLFTKAILRSSNEVELNFQTDKSQDLFIDATNRILLIGNKIEP